MNYYQKMENKRIGNACRRAREKRGLSQTGLCLEIDNFIYDYIKHTANLTELELEQLLKDDDISKLDIPIQNKLKRTGVDCLPKPIALSTISKYENGSNTIPAYYISMLEQICGEIVI